MSPGRTLYAVALLAITGGLAFHILAAGGGTGDGAEPPAKTPVERLGDAPLDGDAFGDLAVASQSGGDPVLSRKLHEIAVRRDPRDTRVRAWLADLHMKAGDYPAALEHLDVILRLSPEAREVLAPMMVQWAEDPAFAAALVDVLRARPIWRRQMDQTLRGNIQQPGAGAIFAGLSATGALSEEEERQWLDMLIGVGDWGLAYSYWVSGLELAPGEPLPMLYNGGFEEAPTDQGFDWRTDRRPGSYTEFEPVEGANGDAAHLVFQGRPVAQANLEQALVLPPGRYLVSMRVKAMALRSDQGLRLSLTCHGQGRPIAEGERLEGSFDWRASTLAFSVPGNNCPGQWLRIHNPAPQGSAQIVSGELWIDDVVLRPMASAG